MISREPGRYSSLSFFLNWGKSRKITRTWTEKRSIFFLIFIPFQKQKVAGFLVSRTRCLVWFKNAHEYSSVMIFIDIYMISCIHKHAQKVTQTKPVKVLDRGHGLMSVGGVYLLDVHALCVDLCWIHVLIFKKYGLFWNWDKQSSQGECAMIYTCSLHNTIRFHYVLATLASSLSEKTVTSNVYAMSLWRQTD